jgi:hypothetical protein
MSANTHINPGKLLGSLLDQWKKQFPKRASGGWWALAGFALQTNVYLLRFFKQLEKHVEPKLAAEMEHLSDIICPADDKFVLIQVKRTLTRASLVSAVEEAYLITDLCRRETPELLNHLRFQIACQTRVTALDVKDLSMSDVIESNGDQTSWNEMLSHFDSRAPIVEEPNSSDQLRTFLWNAGIKSVGALIERCAGRLLLSFGINEPNALGQVAYDLADYFITAERHTAWEAVGRILTTADIESNPEVTEYTDVLTGQQPQLQHLTRGFFKDRPHIFQDLWQAFTRWLVSISTFEGGVKGKVPVFWIGGRSGEGKSVLLLQLVAEALRGGAPSPLLQLKGGDDLPRLFALIPDAAQPFDPGIGYVFVVVDDIYDLHKYERDEWDATVLNECDYRIPPVAIITCGPTEQREQFAARLSGTFEVTHFDVPSLSIEEFHEFISWFKLRTGHARGFNELTTDNPLLVQLMFELARGERIPEFARRFKKRLVANHLFEAARSILAMNALYMDAPLDLVTTDASRDALEYLCKEEQLHFRMTSLDGTTGAAGVRLAHAHLSWLLFIEWIDTAPTTLSKAWARELIKNLKILESSDSALTAGNLLNQLLHTSRLVDDESSGPSPTANRYELIRELYRLSVIDHGGGPSARTLPRWLDLEYKFPGLRLIPDPAEYAATSLSNNILVSSIHGSVATWLWLISESRPPQHAEKLRSAAREFLSNYPDSPGVGVALSRLFGKKRHDQAVNQFILVWLANNCTKAQAYHVLAPMVAANPNDARLKKLSIDWLEVNQKHPQAYQLLATLVSAQPGDARMRQLSIGWLEANRDHRQAYWLLAALVSGWPDDAELKKLSIEWIEVNRNYPHSHELLRALVAGQTDDAELKKLSIDWLEVNQNHPQAYQLLAALVSAQPGDAKMRDLSIDWFETNQDHRQAYWLLGPLVAANPDDDKTRQLSIDWIKANQDHPQAYCLLATLVSARPTDAELKKLSLEWVEMNQSHPHADELLRALVAAYRGDDELKKLSIEWVEANQSHPHAYELLRALVAAYRGDVEVKKLSIDWLKTNHHQAYQLLAPLITTNPSDAEVMELAADWLRRNENHPQYYVLLSVMIARTSGAPEWLNRGEQYVRKMDNVHRQVVLSVLLSAGKADLKFIELAFDFIDEASLKSHRHAVLFSLSRALVYNFNNTIKYLNGSYSAQRKRKACASTAIGMNRFPDTISEFALVVVPKLDLAHVYQILRYTVIRGLEVDYLDEMIAQWLTDNYRRPGYGGLLSALSQNISFWNRLSLHAAVPLKVLKDFQVALKSALTP